MIKQILTGVFMMTLVANSQTIVPAHTIESSVGNYGSAYPSNLGLDIDESTSSSDEFDYGPGIGLGIDIGFISNLGESSGIITHTFASPISISQVWIWNGYFSFELNHCVKDVTLTFKDAAGDVIATEDLVFSESTSEDKTAEVVSLSTEYIGVKEVDFDITTLYGGNDISIRRLGYAGNGFIVGNEELSNSEDFIEIFPNPTKGQLIVELPNNGSNTVVIYNSIGEIVFTSNIDGKTGKYAIDIEDQPAGIYHMNIINDESILSKKIIKQ